MDTFGPDKMIDIELYAAGHAMTGLHRPTLEAAGITYPQYLTLRMLWRRAPQTVRELGLGLRLDSGTLSPMLKRLESKGHLRRERGHEDGRIVLVHLTDRGRQLREQLADLPDRISGARGLTPADHDYLRNLVRRLGASDT